MKCNADFQQLNNFEIRFHSRNLQRSERVYAERGRRKEAVSEDVRNSTNDPTSRCTREAEQKSRSYREQKRKERQFENEVFGVLLRRIKAICAKAFLDMLQLSW